MPKTINDSNIDLETFTASKVRQISKKLESSRSTARHIKQMSSELQATQVNLLRHQRTGIPPNKSKQKQFSNKSRAQNVRYSSKTNQQQVLYKKKFNPRQILNCDDRCHKCGDSKHLEGFQCSAHKYPCSNCHRFGHFSSLCHKKQESFKNTSSRSPKAHQLRCGEVCMPDNSICSQSGDNTSSNESFCLQMQVKSTQAETKLPAPQHFFTNLAFKLKPHKKRTLYLRARIDTWSDVNIMPVSVYLAIFKDTDCKMLAPSSKETGTYTTEKVPVIGSCTLLVVHPKTQGYQEVTFQITSQEGSVVLKIMYDIFSELGLIQPREFPVVGFKPSSA